MATYTKQQYDEEVSALTPLVERLVQIANEAGLQCQDETLLTATIHGGTVEFAWMPFLPQYQYLIVSWGSDPVTPDDIRIGYRPLEGKFADTTTFSKTGKYRKGHIQCGHVHDYDPAEFYRAVLKIVQAVGDRWRMIPYADRKILDRLAIR